jgi:hypothetical protein
MENGEAVEYRQIRGWSFARHEGGISNRRVYLFSGGGDNCEIVIQKRERGTASGSPSQVFVVNAVAASAGRCQRCAPQKRCSHLTIVFMPGGVITPPVSIPSFYSSACTNASATLILGYPCLLKREHEISKPCVGKEDVRRACDSGS